MFLDEVGEIPLELQSKLLRVVQEQQYERVGEEKTRQVDVRIVAATNRDLNEEVQAGRFRQDLYYRLNVFPIHVVPLRQRKEDIPLLAMSFMDRWAKKLNCAGVALTQAQVMKMQAYDWPGNVRELQNVIERTLITSRCGLEKFDLTLPESPGGLTTRLQVKKGQETVGQVLTEEEMRSREKENIEAALTQTEWKVYGAGGAAELLGIKPTTLLSRIKKMGIVKAH